MASCGSKHFFIAEDGTDILHVHSLDGGEVGRHVLGLGPNGFVSGISSSTDGVLHVAISSWLYISSLRAYRVTVD